VSHTALTPEDIVLTPLPRNPRDWPDEARHEVEERIALRLHGSTRPLRRDEEDEVRAWAESRVRAAWQRGGL
jgi:hypothetical protein